MRSFCQYTVVAYIVGALFQYIVTVNAQGSLFTNDFEDFVDEDEFIGSSKPDANVPGSRPIQPDPNTQSQHPVSSDKPVRRDSVPDEYDPDEFIGYEPITASLDPSPVEDDEQPLITEHMEVPTQVKPANKGSELTYGMELCFVAFIIVYGLNFLYGRQANVRIAEAWGREYAELFRKNFTRVNDDGTALVIESPSTYRMNTTGRVNCIGLQAVLDLKRRQDLYSLALGMFFPEHDKLYITVPLPPETERFVFAVCRNTKTFHEANPTVKQFGARVKKTVKLPSKLEAYSESDEATSYILQRSVVSTLTKYEQLIDSILITDQNSHAHHKHVLQVVMRVPLAKDIGQMTVPLKMVLHLIDMLAAIEFSSAARTRVTSNRSEAQREQAKASHASRQEASQERKLERMRAKREELANDPIKLAKLEERERKRMMKKKQKSGKMQLML